MKLFLLTLFLIAFLCAFQSLAQEVTSTSESVVDSVNTESADAGQSLYDNSNEVNLDEQQDNTPRILRGVLNGNYDLIDEALENGEDINTTDENGWNGLAIAVNTRDYDMARELISRGIDMNHPDENGYTPLMHAVEMGDREFVELLLQAGVDPSIESVIEDRVVSALSIAETKKRILIKGLVVEAFAENALERGDLAGVVLAVKAGAHVEMATGSGWTPLILAASAGKVGAVKELVQAGGDIHRSESDGWNPLHFAAQNGHKEVVEYLLEQGARPFYETADGKTAKELALENGFPEIVEILAKAEPSEEL